MSTTKTHAQRRVTEHWTTRDGTGIVWADIDTRHLWNIARHVLRRIRWLRDQIADDSSESRYRRNAAMLLRLSLPVYGFVIDELAYRGALPSQDDLHVAWDRAMARGAETPWCFVELWVAFRGESTTTPEYLAQQAQATNA